MGDIIVFTQPVSQCEEYDPVWGRRCQMPHVHTDAADAETRLHVNREPGDHLTWGSVRDVKEARG